MSRYIDEISARENFQDVLAYMGSEVKRMLKKIPTADVVEVRHGEWVEQIRDYGEYMATEGFKCSVCGYETMDNDKKYCSECGAKMDGKRSENGK